MNYPAGVTQRDITNLSPTDNSFPDREYCFGCKNEMERDEDTGWLFFTDEFPTWKPTHRSDFLTGAFKADQGWWCSTDCYSEHCIEAEPQRLLLVVGGAK